MQIKTYTIPILGGEALSEEMNAFLRSKKILQVEKHFSDSEQGAFWCFCIGYLDDREREERERPKVDYRQVLDAASFKRFSALREIRKRIAEEESVRAYVIFTDEELAAFAKMEPLTAAAMKEVKGVGEKKMEKYAHHFLPEVNHEKG